MKYFFILGKHKELSKSEIQVWLQKLSLQYKIEIEGNGFLILNIDQDIDSDFLMKKLAGTIKIGKILMATTQIDPEELSRILPQKKTMLNFGISPYNLSLRVNELGIKIKKILRQDGIKARFVASKAYPLSSVVVQKNLIKQGVELVLLGANEQIFLGQTIAVQPFEQFSQLDYGRPARDDYSGMLPPKLAQIMLNLSETNANQTILDPFCGSGTVLQQALVLGYENVMGTDASDKSIRASEANLIWLKNKLNFPGKYTLQRSEIENLTNVIKKNSLDAVITEPYLGPPLRGGEDSDKMHYIVKQLEALYRATFKNLAVLLKEVGTIIIVIPQFNIRDRVYEIKVKALLPAALKVRGEWQYAREGQKITRNIYKIKKV